MLELKHVSHHYRKGKTDVPVLDDISLTASEGSLFMIFGPSGCGKTTLLNIAGGLLKPTSGELWVEEASYYSLSSVCAASFRSRYFGYIFQNYYLIEDFSLTYNVVLAMLNTGMKRREKEEYAESLLEKVGLKHRIGWNIQDLSGGEMQRVAIARALANQAKYFFCDEPTGSLDTKTSGEIMELLSRLTEENKTILNVTHDQSFRSLATEILDLS